MGQLQRLIVFDVSHKEGRTRKIQVVLNPCIAAGEGEIIHEEGCLSVADFCADVRRHAKVLVKGLDREGNPVEITGEGLLAVVLQHEIDHLNGILFIDHISRLKRSLFLKTSEKTGGGQVKSGPWRLIFMGTPQFALPSLEAILAAGEEVAAVVTQPDRPRGRGQVVTASPVKELALAWNLPVLQPRRLKDPELISTLQALAPELIIVVAYGRILPPEILALPSVGVLNVHASLLPRYRGAAPINWALIRGEKETGVTIQWLRHEVDSGPIFLQERAPIAATDNAGTLYDRLAERGAALLVQSLEMLRRGEASIWSRTPPQ